MKLYMFRTIPLSIIRSFFHCTHSNGICHTYLLTACKQDQGKTPSWSCPQAVSKPVWHIPLLCVQWKTPDGGRRNCPKHVDFHYKNKFQKSVHLVCFIIRIYHDARSPERQIIFLSYIPWRFDFLDGCRSRNAAWPTVVALRRVLVC